MNKILLILGKALIVCGLLWPIPFGFSVYIPGCYRLYNYLWGDSYMTYGWPLLTLILIGVVLCIIASRKNEPCSMRWEATPIKWLVYMIRYSIIGVVSFFTLTLLVIGLYYTFCTKYSPTIIAILVGTLVAGYLIYVGIKIYKNNRKL